MTAHKTLAMLAVLASACTSTLPMPNQADADAAKRRWPDATLSELERGRTLYVGKCAGCHALKHPSEVHADHWPAEVSEMRNQHGVRLSDEEADAIVRYLISVSSR